MKLVTNDYGCGTSSSILDYGISDVVVVSENDWEKVLDVDDDLLFIGHDVLYYMWDDVSKVSRWESRSSRFEHWVWCFERIDSIVPVWRQKSHASLTNLGRFASRTLACDEGDCDRYGHDWLPQWASPRFHVDRSTVPTVDATLFSGQARKPEYIARNILLDAIERDPFLSREVVVTNVSRSMTWDEYVDNLLKYPRVLNPVGILRALNTRAYEVLYSGRLLLQQTAGSYPRHEAMLREQGNAVFFRNVDDLRSSLRGHAGSGGKITHDDFFENNSLHARMKSIGVEIK